MRIAKQLQRGAPADYRLHSLQMCTRNRYSGNVVDSTLTLGRSLALLGRGPRDYLTCVREWQAFIQWYPEVQYRRCSIDSVQSNELALVQRAVINPRRTGALNVVKSLEQFVQAPIKKSCQKALAVVSTIKTSAKGLVGPARTSQQHSARALEIEGRKKGRLLPCFLRNRRMQKQIRGLHKNC